LRTFLAALILTPLEVQINGSRGYQ
jgi:hypothetical protein